MNEQQPIEKPKGKFGTVNIFLLLVNIILIVGVLWIILDVSGVESSVEEQTQVQETKVVEESIERTEELFISNLHFTIMDRYNIYAMKDEPEFCFAVNGFMNDEGIMQPYIAYSILDKSGNEVVNKLIRQNTVDYKNEFSGCDVIDLNNLNEGLYNLIFIVEDGIDGESAKESLLFRITDYSRHLIYTEFSDQMGERLTIEYTQLNDIMDLGTDQIRNNNKYASGHSIVIESKIDTFSKVEVDEKFKSWIIQEIKMRNSDNLIVYELKNQDFITNIAGDNLFITSIIDTKDIPDGSYTIDIDYVDLYSLESAEASLEVEMI